MCPAVHDRAVGARAARQDLRDFRRRRAMDLWRDAGACNSHGERAARARRQTRRARPGVAAEQCRLPAVWFGLNYLGAVFVPINTAYRGSLLEHAIGLSEARLMIAHADLCPRLKDVDRKAVHELVALGGAPRPLDGISIHPASALESADTNPPTLERPIAP